MTLIHALICQAAGLGAAFALGRSGIPVPFGLFGLACAQGLAASVVAIMLRSPRWWQIIHLVFMPAVILAWQLALPPWFYLAGFVLLASVYWTSFRTQVPLFLSNRMTVYKLAAWAPAVGSLRLLDVGSGTGSLVSRLAALRPDWQVTGIETAPAPYWWSRWRSRHQPAANLIRGDFWQHSLGNYDLVYAFLSPVPMPTLWRKAVREMKPGSWLVSNSFAIPGARHTTELQVGDARGTILYCYRIPGKPRSASTAD